MNKHIIILLLLISQSMVSQTIFGNWKTVDENSGEEKCLVKIYEKDGKVFGKITEITDPEKRDLPCVFCSGADYNKPVLGLNIIKDMEKSGDVYKKGTITNPEDGKVYDCRIKLDDNNPNKLQVRGYITFFYRTQYWIRAD